MKGKERQWREKLGEQTCLKISFLKEKFSRSYFSLSSALQVPIVYSTRDVRGSFAYGVSVKYIRKSFALWIEKEAFT